MAGVDGLVDAMAALHSGRGDHDGRIAAALANERQGHAQPADAAFPLVALRCAGGDGPRDCKITRGGAFGAAYVRRTQGNRDTFAFVMCILS